MKNQAKRFAILLSSSLLSSLCWAGDTVAPALEYVPYKIQQGDTLERIALQYLQRKQDWVALQKINKISNTHGLRPQSVVQLPYDLLKYEALSARVIGLTGSAQFVHDGKTQPLKMDSQLAERDVIKTAANSFVTLELQDGSRLSLPSNSEMQIARLRKIVMSKQPVAQFMVNRGSVESQVAPQTGPSRFEVRSPLAVAGVRGTHFRVGMTEDGSGLASEVLEGAVAVKGNAPSEKNKETLLPASFGNITDKSGKVGGAIALLPAPTLTDPGKIQDEKPVVFDFTPHSDAKQWRAKISKNAGFTQVLMSQRSRTPQVAFNDLPDGNYFLQVSVVDKNGLEGLTKTYAFSRRYNPLDPSAVKNNGTELEFAWTGKAGADYRFQLAKDQDFQKMVVDVDQLQSTQLEVSNLRQGAYFWRVISTSMIDGQKIEKASKPGTFEVFETHAK